MGNKDQIDFICNSIKNIENILARLESYVPSEYRNIYNPPTLSNSNMLRDGIEQAISRQKDGETKLAISRMGDNCKGGWFNG